MKPGFKTTEFWLSLVALAGATVMLLSDQIDGTAWMVTLTGVTSAYSLARGTAKVTMPTGSVTDAE